VRTRSIKLSDFMSGEYKNINKKALQSKIRTIAKGSIIPIIYGFTGNYNVLTAESSPTTQVTKNQIIHAFDPLIDLMVSLSLPIAGVMLTGGALLIMIGQKDKGFTLIMNASLGYVLVNLTPLFMSLLESVGKAI